MYRGSQDKGYKKQIKSFMDCIINDVGTPINISDVFHGMDVVFGIIESIKQKKVVEF